MKTLEQLREEIAQEAVEQLQIKTKEVEKKIENLIKAILRTGGNSIISDRNVFLPSELEIMSTMKLPFKTEEKITLKTVRGYYFPWTKHTHPDIEVTYTLI